MNENNLLLMNYVKVHLHYNFLTIFLIKKKSSFM